VTSAANERSCPPSVDGVLEIEDLAAHVDADLAREVAGGPALVTPAMFRTGGELLAIELTFVGEVLPVPATSFTFLTQDRNVRQPLAGIVRRGLRAARSQPEGHVSWGQADVKEVAGTWKDLTATSTRWRVTSPPGSDMPT